MKNYYRTAFELLMKIMLFNLMKMLLLKYLWFVCKGRIAFKMITSILISLELLYTKNSQSGDSNFGSIILFYIFHHLS